MTTDRFELDAARLAGFSAEHEIRTDHDAVLMLNEAIMGDEPAITGPCEIAAELLAEDGDGSVDGWRVIISTGGPWLGAEISRVSYRTAGADGSYDAAEIASDVVTAANLLLDWYEDTIGPPGLLEAIDAVAREYRELASVRDDESNLGEQAEIDAESAYQRALEELASQARAWAGRNPARPWPVIECCPDAEPVPYPQPGQDTRCDGCGTRFTAPAESGNDSEQEAAP